MRPTSFPFFFFFAAATAAVTGGAVVEREAQACGGCFHPPPPPTETVVSAITDHRMVLSVSAQQTTLYDQVRYQGNPKDFAWVLPINGAATVGLSADSLFGTLDALTATTVEAPPDGCPAGPTNCSSSVAFGASASDNAGAAHGGVSVIRQEVVGPYATVQLASTNPTALTDWLSQNGYAVPPDVAPIIAAYVEGHYDFLAIKLRPGANVAAMRPVRVTTAGGSPVLPLRMVAAGTGPSVGVTLWVVAEGRYEAQNFPNFTIKSSELVWDWPSQSSNYAALRAQRSADGKSWETETSTAFVASTISQAVQYGYYAGGAGFGGAPISVNDTNDYAPVTDAQGTVVQTADQARDADMAVLFAGGLTSPRITRLHANLAHASLAADLNLQPAGDAAELSGRRQAALESGQPQCAVYQGCTQTGMAPRDVAIARSKSTANAFACSAAGAAPPANAPSGLGTFAALAGFFGYAFARKRRRA